MRILPYETFTIHTQESLGEVIDRLQPYIEKPHILSRENGSRDRIIYVGKISETGFEVCRVIHHHHSFLPNIRGRFESSSQGTNIRITMGLDSSVTIFLLFWFSGWYSIYIPIFLARGLAWEDGLFLGMPIVAFVIFWSAFWYEANRSRRELTAMILGQSLAEEELITKSISKRLWIIGIAVAIVVNIATFIVFFLSSS